MTEFEATPDGDGGFTVGAVRETPPGQAPVAGQTGGVQPVIPAATVSAISAALLALLVAFGVPLSETQTAAILGFVSVAAPIIVAYVAWRTTVEYQARGQVVRGPANEGPTREVVREAGDLYEPKRAR